MLYEKLKKEVNVRIVKRGNDNYIRYYPQIMIKIGPFKFWRDYTIEEENGYVNFNNAVADLAIHLNIMSKRYLEKYYKKHPNEHTVISAGTIDLYSFDKQAFIAEWRDKHNEKEV